MPFPSPGDLPNSGIQPRSPGLQVDSLPSKPPGKTIPKIAPTHLLMSEILITGKKGSDARQGDKGSTGPKNKTTGVMRDHWFYSWPSSFSLVPSSTEKNKRKRAWLLILFEPQVECADFHRDRQFKLLWRITCGEFSCLKLNVLSKEQLLGRRLPTSGIYWSHPLGPHTQETRTPEYGSSPRTA